MGGATLPLHSFGRLPKLLVHGGRQPPNARGRAQAIAITPLVPSPTAVLYVSCNCRACCSSGHSRRGQGKRAKRRMGARAALQMGLRPQQTRISIGR